ncbi:MAG: hypothetical protein JRG73_14365 [Deltaproteobacteria bacterium]|nr:hypothetical protein [Deltaproteobacteria bacterium]MBW2308107.1 hypothetical protein [Deltaproteobacteria bacterium]
MGELSEEKKDDTGQGVEILGPTYEPGKPDQPFRWREKLKNREHRLRYLQNAERYWYSKDWYGSEKRKTEA